MNTYTQKIEKQNEELRNKIKELEKELDDIKNPKVNITSLGDISISGPSGILGGFGLPTYDPKNNSYDYMIKSSKENVDNKKIPDKKLTNMLKYNLYRNLIWLYYIRLF